MSDDPRHSLGRRGEELAAEHLERLGYRVVARNYRTRFGELDLVAPTTTCSCSARSRRAARAASRGTASARPSAGRCGAWGGRGCQRGPRPPADARSCASTRSASSSTGAARSCGSSTRRARSDREPRPRHGVRPRRRRLPAGLGRGRHPHRAARVHDRRARGQGGPGGARAGALRDHQLRLRVPAEAHHDQPRARLPAQDRPGLRPAAGDGDPRGERPGRARAGGGLRVRRRAVADRGAAADPRRAGGRAGRARARARADRRAGRRGRARRRWSRASRSSRADSLHEVADILAGRAEVPPLPERVRGAATSRGARPAGHVPTSAATTRCCPRSSSPRPAATTCSSTGRRAPARR